MDQPMFVAVVAVVFFFFNELRNADADSDPKINFQVRTLENSDLPKQGSPPAAEFRTH